MPTTQMMSSTTTIAIAAPAPPPGGSDDDGVSSGGVAVVVVTASGVGDGAMRSMTDTSGCSESRPAAAKPLSPEAAASASSLATSTPRDWATGVWLSAMNRSTSAEPRRTPSIAKRVRLTRKKLARRHRRSSLSNESKSSSKFKPTTAPESDETVSATPKPNMPTQPAPAAGAAVGVAVARTGAAVGGDVPVAAVGAGDVDVGAAEGDLVGVAEGGGAGAGQNVAKLPPLDVHACPAPAWSVSKQ
mmetsp:Transcript_49028/g.120129  ORF Transcript_49028/g.120129 Transcript_49028/m.120129 type:complete len:245 (-) Transcript_49028:1560-2294(-)